MDHLPKLNLPTSPGKPADKSVHFSPVFGEVAQLGISGVFTRIMTAAEGLNEEEAATPRYAQSFLAPLVLARLLSFLLSPPVRRSEHWCLDRSQ